MLPDVGMTAGARTLWQEELFFDYTILVENKEFKVHKVIMASVSDYFKVMLQGSMAESKNDKVRIGGFSSLAVKNMIEFIYTGQFGSEQASAQELLAFADYLRFPAAIEQCTKLLCSEVDTENCFDIITYFKAYSLTAGIEQIVKYIKANFDEIMQNFVPHAITFDELLILVEVWQKSEFDLFSSIKQWIYLDYETRQQHIDKFMSYVRFGLMTTEQLANIKETDMYTESDGAWRNLIKAAEEYHELPVHQKVLDKSEQSRIREEPLVMCYEEQTNSTTLNILKNDMSWEQHDIPKKAGFRPGEHSYIVVNDYLIVSDAISYCSDDQAWYIFDPRSLKWSTMASLAAPRSNFALVNCNDHMYALGGRTGSSIATRRMSDCIERYDFQRDAWDIVPSKLPIALHSHQAAAIEGSIYITGGWKSAGPDSLDDFSLRLDCYDVSTNTWHSKAAQIPRVGGHFNKLNVMQLGQENVLFYLDYGFIMRYYRPSTDQWSTFNCSLHITSKLVWWARGAVLAHRNSLFLINYPYDPYDSNTNSAKFGGGCVKWTFEGSEKDISEVRLQDLSVVPEEVGKGLSFFGITEYL